MREWIGFKTHGTLDGHVVRLTLRDFPIFQRLPHGAEYPKALEIAERLFEEKLDDLASAGCRLEPASARYTELRRATIPPYDPEKFPNKWWKLEPTAPSRTLTAHIGKDTYSHIHYDSRQKRTISVREAARLQSFPDGFRFAGTMNSAFRQIGNAVPPLVALAVARTLKQIMLNAATPTGHRNRHAA
jgi:DNA (cytosine-5)-methyltransferase 1